MPIEIIRAFAVLKKAAALANEALGVLDHRRAAAIAQVCDEITAGAWDDHFPLVVWQTGSGTHSNMNVNEVIANRANERLGERLIHPNDHVNCSQSSNDTFPGAMHIAALTAVEDGVLPRLQQLHAAFDTLSHRYRDVIKLGRTHLQDATPLTLGQEISGWAAMLEKDDRMLRSACEGLRELALGGTAVGTGLNAPVGFDTLVAEKISELTGKRFVTAPNKFHALTSKDQLVFAHGALKALAADLMKIANNIRLLAGGPRCGLGELNIPQNEPGSSIMPGKVNPVIPEVVSQVAFGVVGNDVTISMAAEAGQLELNAFEPVIFYKLFESITTLTGAVQTLVDNCITGITANEAHCEELVEHSVGIITALCPYIGYSMAADIAKAAIRKNISVRQELVERNVLSQEQIDRYMDPYSMT